MQEYMSMYKQELLGNVVPFWMENSKDEKHGGYFTCLDRTGKVYDTDKFVWLQARQVWMFSYLCQQVEFKEEWLDMAKHGADFLLKHGRNEKGDFYFSLNRKGQPLVHPYSIFSDCFAAMAFSSIYQLTSDKVYADIAIQTYHNILKRKDNPKGSYSKVFPGTRELKGFSLPMILSNLTLEMEHLLDEKLIQQIVPQVIKEVMEDFYFPEKGLILENISPEGAFSDSYEGRLMSPGHVLEAMWFMLDLSERFNDEALADKAIKIGLNTLEYGWDKHFGGIYYFMDIKGHPSEKLEWNQKLWWVHLETLVFLAKAMKVNEDPLIKSWFERVHEYTWKRFKDPVYNEWYGYLDRFGNVQLDLKGGKWKGCFHVPRALYQVWKTLELVQEQKVKV